MDFAERFKDRAVFVGKDGSHAQLVSVCCGTEKAKLPLGPAGPGAPGAAVGAPGLTDPRPKRGAARPGIYAPGERDVPTVASLLAVGSGTEPPSRGRGGSGRLPSVRPATFGSGSAAGADDGKSVASGGAGSRGSSVGEETATRRVHTDARDLHRVSRIRGAALALSVRDLERAGGSVSSCSTSACGTSTSRFSARRSPTVTHHRRTRAGPSNGSVHREHQPRHDGTAVGTGSWTPGTPQSAARRRSTIVEACRLPPSDTMAFQCQRVIVAAAPSRRVATASPSTPPRSPLRQPPRRSPRAGHPGLGSDGGGPIRSRLADFSSRRTPSLASSQFSATPPHRRRPHSPSPSYSDLSGSYTSYSYSYSSYGTSTYSSSDYFTDDLAELPRRPRQVQQGPSEPVKLRRDGNRAPLEAPSSHYSRPSESLGQRPGKSRDGVLAPGGAVDQATRSRAHMAGDRGRNHPRGAGLHQGSNRERGGGECRNADRQRDGTEDYRRYLRQREKEARRRAERRGEHRGRAAGDGRAQRSHGHGQVHAADSGRERRRGPAAGAECASRHSGNRSTQHRAIRPSESHRERPRGTGSASANVPRLLPAEATSSKRTHRTQHRLSGSGRGSRPVDSPTSSDSYRGSTYSSSYESSSSGDGRGRTRRRKRVAYTPHTVTEYKALLSDIQAVKRGGLGFADTDAQRAAKARSVRAAQYAAQVREQQRHEAEVNARRRTERRHSKASPTVGSSHAGEGESCETSPGKTDSPTVDEIASIDEACRRKLEKEREDNMRNLQHFAHADRFAKHPPVLSQSSASNEEADVGGSAAKADKPLPPPEGVAAVPAVPSGPSAPPEGGRPPQRAAATVVKSLQRPSGATALKAGQNGVMQVTRPHVQTTVRSLCCDAAPAGVAARKRGHQVDQRDGSEEDPIEICLSPPSSPTDARPSVGAKSNVARKPLSQVPPTTGSEALFRKAGAGRPSSDQSVRQPLPPAVRKAAVAPFPARPKPTVNRRFATTN